MRLFWELTLLAVRRQLTYRAATLAGLMTNLFFGLLRAVVLMALYGAREEVAGMTVQDAITYTGLTQAAIAYLSIFGWYDLMDSVYTGQVGADLLKPLGYFRFWLALDLGRALVALVTRGLSILLLYALVVDLTVPQGMVQWMGLAAALFLSWLVSFGWRFLVNLASFWTPNARGIGRFAFGSAWVLSGFFMPLRFFPQWFIDLSHLTPFPSMVNTVIEVYLGLLQGPALLQALAVQLAWAAALALLCSLVLRAGLGRLVIQGG
ncbi:ABC-2 family transporter protein [Litorilinea aerophila]|uniref:ABC transporter permease n=1 Tax=Litorilinea aerophila TaxID=1204385 RepID=UPI001B87A9EE|nr:ABC-2 family transporter protein [Litorilinea aerophila]MCC9075368.1 ABC-2 family transporter protein [Litorilinea aerophila]GIV79239.1 MAG: ABC transporter permease [Litorilinea sp.]GIV79244.1 MAG: ABC transporter permease [Litorilinea sp.]